MRTPSLMVASTNDTITLNWTGDPLSDGGWYEVFRNDGFRYRTETNSLSFYATDGTYTFWVAQYDLDGTSMASSPVTYTLDSALPQTPRLTLTSEGIIVRLTWVSVPGAVHYELICNGEWVGDAPGNPATDELFGYNFAHHAWHDGVYHYQVRARDRSGRWSPFSRQATHIVDTAPPAAPTPSATAQGLNVHVSWSKPAERAVEYHVRRNGQDVGTTTELSFHDMVPEAGPYSYRVRTVDSERKESKWSEVTEASTIYVGRVVES